MITSRVAVEAAGAPAAIGPYSHAVAVNGLLFCSGQIALDPETGEFVGGSVGEQAVRCLRNLSAVCEAAGTTLAAAVRVTVYLTDMDDFAALNEVYGDFFDAEPPARAAIAVAGLPKGADVEIEAVVALPS